MKRHIYTGMALLAAVGILLTAAGMCVLFYIRFQTEPGAFGEFLLDSIPVTLGAAIVIAAAGYPLAARLTRKIAEPVNRIDPGAPLMSPYDELAPFVLAVERRRERAEAELAELRNRFETALAIMGSMNEGVVLIDGRGVILMLNKSAAALLDAEPSMNGRSILELMRGKELIDGMRGALLGERSETALERSGRTFRVLFSPVPENGAAILFLDITDRAAAERMRREFSANVSHELKTPLTGIYGHAEMLLNGMVKEADRPEFFEKIKDEASRLIALTGDIIKISEIDESRGREAFADMDITHVAAEAAGALAEKAAGLGVTVEILAESTVIKASRPMIYEIFYNLIDNAVTYNRPGGSVRVEVRSEDGHALIRVADTGVGIPKNEQERVFERFYRVDKSRSKKTGGTGLGLAIVKHAALAHGGEINLESEPGKGTAISVRIN